MFSVYAFLILYFSIIRRMKWDLKFRIYNMLWWHLSDYSAPHFFVGLKFEEKVKLKQGDEADQL